MLCAIYKSKKRDGMYLYVAKRNYFDDVPEGLLQAFGTPIFVMLFNLAGAKPLAQADKSEVLRQIQTNSSKTDRTFGLIILLHAAFLIKMLDFTAM